MYTVSYNARSCSAVPTVKNTTAQSTHTSLNPLKSNGNYSATLNNIKKVGTLAVDGWAVTFGIARRPQSTTAPRWTKCNSPPINGQCTNHHSAV